MTYNTLISKPKKIPKTCITHINCVYLGVGGNTLAMTNTSHFEYIQATILKELDETKAHVIVAVSWLTDPVLYHKLYALCRKGKKVELLLNYDQINLSSGLDFEKMKEAGGQIFWEYESEKRLMHNKFCLIDDETIITGSYNWTNKAKSNNENILVIKGDFPNVTKFKNEFYRLTNQSGLITTETFSVNKYDHNGLTTYKSFLDWWENGFIELRIAISERLFNKKYDFYSLPTEEDFNLLMKTTALDLEFAGNLLVDYKTSIQQHFNDYGSFQAEYGYNLSGLNGIENIRHLEYLNCSWNDIVNLEPLSSLRKLSYLDLSNNGRMQAVLFEVEMDLQPLKYLSNLEYLNLMSNNNLKNFEALFYLKSLRTLDLSDTNVTQEELEAIKSKLPSCEVLTDSIEYDNTEYEYEEDDFDDLDDTSRRDKYDDDLPF